MVGQGETLINWKVSGAGGGGGANSMTPKKTGASVYGV